MYALREIVRTGYLFLNEGDEYNASRCASNAFDYIRENPDTAHAIDAFLFAGDIYLWKAACHKKAHLDMEGLLESLAQLLHDSLSVPSLDSTDTLKLENLVFKSLELFKQESDYDRVRSVGYKIIRHGIRPFACNRILLVISESDRLRNRLDDAISTALQALDNLDNVATREYLYQLFRQHGDISEAVAQLTEAYLKARQPSDKSRLIESIVNIKEQHPSIALSPDLLDAINTFLKGGNYLVFPFVKRWFTVLFPTPTKTHKKSNKKKKKKKTPPVSTSGEEEDLDALIHEAMEQDQDQRVESPVSPSKRTRQLTMQQLDEFIGSGRPYKDIVDAIQSVLANESLKIAKNVKKGSRYSERARLVKTVLQKLMDCLEHRADTEFAKHVDQLSLETYRSLSNLMTIRQVADFMHNDIVRAFVLNILKNVPFWFQDTSNDDQGYLEHLQQAEQQVIAIRQRYDNDSHSIAEIELMLSFIGWMKQRLAAPTPRLIDGLLSPIRILRKIMDADPHAFEWSIRYVNTIQLMIATMTLHSDRYMAADWVFLCAEYVRLEPRDGSYLLTTLIKYFRQTFSMPDLMDWSVATLVLLSKFCVDLNIQITVLEEAERALDESYIPSRCLCEAGEEKDKSDMKYLYVIMRLTQAYREIGDFEKHMSHQMRLISFLKTAPLISALSDITSVMLRQTIKDIEQKIDWFTNECIPFYPEAV